MIDYATVVTAIATGCAIGWLVSHLKVVAWQRAAEAYLALLEEQRQLVDGVLDLNAVMLADRMEAEAAARQQEAEFLARTHTGFVN